MRVVHPVSVRTASVTILVMQCTMKLVHAHYEQETPVGTNCRNVRLLPFLVVRHSPVSDFGVRTCRFVWLLNFNHICFRHEFVKVRFCALSFASGFV